MSTEEGAPEPVSRARSHIIERPRLTKLLDESKARILLLVAPAGYGKTTLARQWCERSHITSTWFWARPASVDLAVLATGIAQACARIVDDAGQRMRDRLLTSPSPDDEPHDIAELLAADLPGWPIDAWLVIDDYHHLAKSRAAEAFIETLVDLAPLRTLVTTRQRPSWLSGRDLVYGDAFELDQAPLTFTRREATGILRRALKSESIVESARG